MTLEEALAILRHPDGINQDKKLLKKALQVVASSWAIVGEDQ